MNDDLSKKIIERIDSEQIAPLSRSHFLLLRSLFWIFAVLSVIIGGLAIGTMIFLATSLYFKGLLFIPHDIVEILLMIPYLWLIVFILFIIITRTSIKNTKKGYRYSLLSVVILSVALSAILGVIFYVSGIGEFTHHFLNNSSPFYNYVVHDADDAMQLHQKGLLQSH